MESGRYDENCCAIKGTASCKDEYELNFLTKTCFDNGETVAHFFECLSPPEVGAHDSSKCYDNYGPNSYCCAAKRFAYCEDDYIIEYRDRCSATGEEFDFKCFDPSTYEGVFVHHPDKCLINGQASYDCCGFQSAASCMPGFMVRWTEESCFATTGASAKNFECVPAFEEKATGLAVKFGLVLVSMASFLNM